ncbi:hypothetical protein [Nocardia nova]|uniref:hypothetical protein n=1 Tax=Nocardia nova TaxID=37330 RepID=UPI003410DFCE
MASPRPSWAWIGLVLVLAVPVSGCATHTVQRPSPASATTVSSSVAHPSVTSEVHQAPTTDLFGNRLEVTVADGRALSQDPGGRPSPAAEDYLSAAPARMTWQRGWGGAALPTSGSDGPARIEQGIASGFADTPQGAALAACDAVARALAAPDGLWQNIIRARFLGDVDAVIARMARSRANTPDAARYATVPDGIRVRTGFRPDFAIVDVATRARDGYTVASWPMAYAAGDWRVRIPEDIETLWRPGDPLDSLAGFGQWRTAP